MAGRPETTSRFARCGAGAALTVMCGMMTACDPPVISISETAVTVVDEDGGKGRPAAMGDYVTIKYRLEDENGRVVLEHDRFSFTLGAGVVIAGVDDAVVGMRQAGKRQVLVPPQKHWGRAGYGNGAIKPNATLTLHVQLLSVRKA